MLTHTYVAIWCHYLGHNGLILMWTCTWSQIPEGKKIYPYFEQLKGSKPQKVKFRQTTDACITHSMKWFNPGNLTYRYVDQFESEMPCIQYLNTQIQCTCTWFPFITHQCSLFWLKERHQIANLNTSPKSISQPKLSLVEFVAWVIYWISFPWAKQHIYSNFHSWETQSPS